MIVYIKNMVCDRCKSAVVDVLRNLDMPGTSVELGEVDFGESRLTTDQLYLLKAELEPLGFEIIDDKKSRLIQNIKQSIIELVRKNDEFHRIKVSDYLKQNLHYDYSHLSSLFSEVEGITVEQYLIRQKIERVKELLVYDEMSLTEIAQQLGYSSLAHLSTQFKKVTGLTPSHFRNLKDAKQRRSLDKL